MDEWIHKCGPYMLLFSLGMEGSSDTCYNRDEPQNARLSELSQSQKTNTVRLPRYKVPKEVMFIETQRRIMSVRNCESRNGEWLFSGYRSCNKARRKEFWKLVT